MAAGRVERRLWAGAALCLAVTYSLIFVGRPLAEALREHHLLGASVLVACGVVAALLLPALVRRHPGPRELAVLAVVVGLYGAIYWRLDVVEERLHLLEYGLLGGLLFAALRQRWRERGMHRPALAAALAAAVLGWIDEGIQYLLPERYYDLRDVLLNVGAAALAVAGLWAMELLRSRDAARGGASSGVQ